MNSDSYTKVLGSRDITRSIHALDDKLRTRIIALLQGLLRQLTSNGFIQLSPIESIRVIRDTPTEDHIELALRNIILNGVLNAENRCPGAGLMSFIFYMMLSDTTCHDQIIKNIRNTNINARRCTSAEAFRYVNNIVQDKLANNILNDVLRLAGSKGQITFETIPGSFSFKTINETGIRMPGLIEEKFSKAIELKSKHHLSDVGVVAYDGTIETVSEIFNLCNGAVERNMPLVICAKNFGAEVITTLIANWTQGIAKIVPVVFRDDPHAIDDIVMIHELIYYGLGTGQPISTININDVTIIKKARITGHRYMFLSQGNTNVARARVKSVRRQIVNAISKRQYELCDLLREREKDMSVNSFRVYLGSSFNNSVYSLKDKLELGCRVFGDTCHHGIVDARDLLIDHTPDDELQRWLLKVAYVNVRAVDIGILVARTIIRDISSISKGIVID